ncbi:MAG TPA: hypothetical protein VN310_11035 [Candidatus Dormibacteraeota bacterium]|nr:hypothetical protein [Candidatus Dormibacteraeota bacterium]
MDEDVSKPESQAASKANETTSLLDGYTAFQKWEYDKVFYAESSPKSWLDIGESFYRASLLLVEGVAENRLSEDTEGIAAAFLFRHYLELSLKSIILAGRFLSKDGQNAPSEEAVPAWGHKLGELWKLVLRDAKPKMQAGDWDNLDAEFVEKCIGEFEMIDPHGLAFRYADEGAESLRVHFQWLYAIMEHVHQVLEGIRVYLVEMHGQNADYESYLQSEFRGDIL